MTFFTHCHFVILISPVPYAKKDPHVFFYKKSKLLIFTKTSLWYDRTKSRTGSIPWLNASTGTWGRSRNISTNSTIWAAMAASSWRCFDRLLSLFGWLLDLQSHANFARVQEFIILYCRNIRNSAELQTKFYSF
jgi:hypothetical protein